MHTSFSDSDVLGKFTDDPIPLRLQPAPISGALEIAILVQAVSVEKGAELIQAYADAAASAGRLEGTMNTADRILAVIEDDHA